MFDHIDSSVWAAIVGTIGTMWIVFYKTNGRTLRKEIKELRDQIEELQKETESLRMQLSPNPTPTFWLNDKEEIITCNGTAITKILTRIGKNPNDITGHHISSILGIDEFSLVKKAISAPGQMAIQDSFIIAGKITSHYAVAYVTLDSREKNAMVELQLVI